MERGLRNDPRNVPAKFHRIPFTNNGEIEIQQEEEETRNWNSKKKKKKKKEKLKFEKKKKKKKDGESGKKATLLSLYYDPRNVPAKFHRSPFTNNG